MPSGGGPNIKKEIFYILTTWIVVKSWINGRPPPTNGPSTGRLHYPKPPIFVH